VVGKMAGVLGRITKNSKWAVVIKGLKERIISISKLVVVILGVIWHSKSKQCILALRSWRLKSSVEHLGRREGNVGMSW
jgi:hypothetical protein